MGLTTVSSEFGASDTVARLEAAITSAGMAVLARVDHSAAAAAVHLALRTTKLVIFGNARSGTPLMQASQTLGIDLPLKALIYEDTSGKVWVTYNDPRWVAERHGLGAEAAPSVAMITSALENVVTQATGAQTKIAP